MVDFLKTKKIHVVLTVAIIACGIIYFTIGTFIHDAKHEFEQEKQNNTAVTGENISLVARDSRAAQTYKTIEVFGEVSQSASIVTAPMNSVVKKTVKEGSILKSGQPVITLINGTALPIPFDGVVSDIFVDEGQHIKTGDNLFVALQTSSQNTTVNVDLPIADANEITTTMPASVYLQDKKYEGTVKYISKYSQKNSGSVRVAIRLPKNNIPHNSAVRVVINIASSMSHYVPKTAVALSEGKTIVKTIADEDVIKSFYVNIINEDADGFYVSGLPDEVKIILYNPGYAIDGQKYKYTLL